jgi:hypothetical protein
VAGGTDGETLLEIADQLCAALGFADDEGAATESGPILSRREPERDAGPLSVEDERLVVGMRNSLAKVAAAVGAGRATGIPERAVGAALDWAELVMRGELACGRAAQLAALMPSLVFMVTLPIVDQDEAIELSRRTSALLERALGG